MLNKLPPDLRTNILSRLPVDSLLRLRCVSKSNCAEIDDPNFIKTHLKRSMETNSTLGMIFVKIHPDSIYSMSFDSLDTVVELDYPLKTNSTEAMNLGFLSDNMRIVGSCNGLLCFSNAIGRVALINPSTRKFQTLPFLPLEHKTKKKLDWNTWTLGFGYDPIGDDYKVVRLGQFMGVSARYFANETMIYSLKSNSWRKIEGMSYILGTDHKMGLLHCDALHWSVDRNRILSTPKVIVAFELGTENFREVPEPQLDVGQEPTSLSIGSVGKWLSICAIYYGGLRLDFWVMKEYGVKESWTKLVSFTPNLTPVFKCMARTVFSLNGDDFLIGMQEKDLVWYNLKKKAAFLMGMPAAVGTPVGAELFHGSLVPLNVDAKKPGSKKAGRKGKKKNKMNRDEFLSKGFKLNL